MAARCKFLIEAKMLLFLPLVWWLVTNLATSSPPTQSDCTSFCKCATNQENYLNGAQVPNLKIGHWSNRPYQHLFNFSFLLYFLLAIQKAALPFRVSKHLQKTKNKNDQHWSMSLSILLYFPPTRNQESSYVRSSRPTESCKRTS